MFNLNFEIADTSKILNTDNLNVGHTLIFNDL